MRHLKLSRAMNAVFMPKIQSGANLHPSMNVISLLLFEMYLLKYTLNVLIDKIVIKLFLSEKYLGLKVKICLLILYISDLSAYSLTFRSLSFKKEHYHSKEYPRFPSPVINRKNPLKNGGDVLSGDYSLPMGEEDYDIMHVEDLIPVGGALPIIKMDHLAVSTPDYLITTTAGHVVITDLSGNGDQLTMSQNGSNIRFVVSPNSRTYSIDGGDITAFSTPAEVPLANIASIVINADGGNDVINIRGFSVALPDLTINGGKGNDAINFTGIITFAPDAHLDVDLQNDDITPGIDQVSVSSNARLNLSGSGRAIFRASRNISISRNGMIATENGDLVLEANMQSIATTGGFAGISITGGLLRSNGTGDIIVRAKGGTTGVSRHGVVLTEGGRILGGSGKVYVEGLGGNSANDGNCGVYVRDNNSLMTSMDGDVLVRGIGGGIGNSAFNYGVCVALSGQISCQGAGTLNVFGQGGNSAGINNHGVFVSGNMAKINSLGGDVWVKGIGGGTDNSSSNYGVFVSSSALITTDGMGVVRVEGQGGSSTGMFNYGVYVRDQNSYITSSGGDVMVKGTGGGKAADIIVERGGSITSTSTTSGIELECTVNGFWPFTADIDVSTTAAQKTIFSAGSKLNIQINGLRAHRDYHQLGVLGGIDLNNVELTFVGSTYVPKVGDRFLIVDNEGTDAIFSNFNRLPEGALISDFLGSGLYAQITYLGGSGNDVYLEVIACDLPMIRCPSTQTLSLDTTCSSLLPDYTGMAIATCGDQILSVSQAPIPGTSILWSEIEDGTLMVTLTVNESNRNTTRCTFSVELVTQYEEMIVMGSGQEIENGSLTYSPFNKTLMGTVPLLGEIIQQYEVVNGSCKTIKFTGVPTINITGPDAAFFEVAIPPSVDQLDPWETTSFQLKYSGTTFGFHEAVVEIETNEGNYMFGVAAATSLTQIQVMGNAMLIPNGMLSPRTIDFTDFGIVDFNSRTEREFFIRNVGTETLHLTGTPRIRLSGPGARKFVISRVPDLFVPGGSDQVFSVRFDATEIGDFQALLWIENSDAGNSPYVFAIKAMVLAPNMKVVGNDEIINNNSTLPSVTNLTDFGVQAINSQTDHDFYVLNEAGSGLLVLTGSPRVTISGSGAEMFSVSSTPFMFIEADNRSLLRICYHPVSAGIHEALVTIRNNDPNTDPYTFAIRGQTNGAFPHDDRERQIPPKGEQITTLKVYPNPTRSELYIEAPRAEKAYGLEIIDQQGRLVWSAETEGGLLEYRSELLKTGVYILRTTLEDVNPIRWLKVD